MGPLWWGAPPGRGEGTSPLAPHVGGTGPSLWSEPQYTILRVLNIRGNLDRVRLLSGRFPLHNMILMSCNRSGWLALPGARVLHGSGGSRGEVSRAGWQLVGTALGARVRSSLVPAGARSYGGKNLVRVARGPIPVYACGAVHTGSCEWARRCTALRSGAPAGAPRSGAPADAV